MPQYLVLLTYRPGEGPQEGTPSYDAEMAVWGALNDELREAGRSRAAWTATSRSPRTPSRTRSWPRRSSGIVAACRTGPAPG
jgi:hypothetical protein